jgi:NAD-dependent SIR2 family protein deacetylase
MSEETIRCADCGRDFQHSEKDQAFYQEKGFSAPKRCKECRQAKKDQRGGGRSSGGRDDLGAIQPPRWRKD